MAIFTHRTKNVIFGAIGKNNQQGISYGANEVRDGVNLTSQTKNISLVSATDIQSLEPNEAFVKLPGNVPIAKIKLKIVKT